MYLDEVVLFGLVIVALTCIMITYVGIYSYRHIKADTAASNAAIASSATGLGQVMKSDK